MALNRSAAFMLPDVLFVGYRRVAGGWSGLLRLGHGGPVAFECTHRHRCRDNSTVTWGLSARDCAYSARRQLASFIHDGADCG